MESERNGSEVLSIIDEQFADLLKTLRNLTSKVPPSLLYQHPPAISIGENILRSAGVAEQTFGGLTVNLWDDPFEWTLPESLPRADLISQYLDEVDEARETAIASFATDIALTKLVSLPSGETKPLLTVLLSALTRAAEFKGRAYSTWKILSDKSTDQLII